MIGSHAVPVLTDLLAKNEYNNTYYNSSKILEACMKTAN